MDSIVRQGSVLGLCLFFAIFINDWETEEEITDLGTFIMTIRAPAGNSIRHRPREGAESAGLIGREGRYVGLHVQHEQMWSDARRQG
jgi:hypothetical protein